MSVAAVDPVPEEAELPLESPEDEPGLDGEPLLYGFDNISVFPNTHGQVAIMQRNDYREDHRDLVVFPPECAAKVIEAIRKAAEVLAEEAA